MAVKDEVKLVYVHDPMCSWCWGFSRTFYELVASLPDSVALVRLLGGLAPDSDEPMPAEMQTYLRQTWRNIQVAAEGTRFNFDFWSQCQPRRSTWPACRAVIAARKQGVQYDEAMTRAIQHAYYLQARNPSEHDTLTSLAGELGLDTASFKEDLNAVETRQKLEGEMTLARQMGVTGFPSLLLLHDQKITPIRPDFNDVGPMLDGIRLRLNPGACGS